MRLVRLFLSCAMQRPLAGRGRSTTAASVHTRSLTACRPCRPRRRPPARATRPRTPGTTTRRGTPTSPRTSRARSRRQRRCSRARSRARRTGGNQRRRRRSRSCFRGEEARSVSARRVGDGSRGGGGEARASARTHPICQPSESGRSRHHLGWTSTQRIDADTTKPTPPMTWGVQKKTSLGRARWAGRCCVSKAGGGERRGETNMMAWLPSPSK